jgi:hypothetical protein
MKKALFLMFTTFVVGCASVQTVPPVYQTGSFPPINSSTVVNVGQVMVSEYDYLAQDRAILRDSLPGSFWSGRSGAVAGTALVAAISSGEKVYCLPPGGNGFPCLKDSNGDGYFDRSSTMNMYGMLVNESNISNVGYRQANQNIEDGFKYELIYQGRDGDVVRIAYREYTENLARPAFSQDLTYTLDEAGSTSVRFKDVSLTIHGADNNEIRYTVQSGF